MQKKNQVKAKGSAEKPRLSATQRKIRRQQIGMAIIGAILILAMIMALSIR
ncbi:MAG: hypothetical protein ABFD24_00895 [Anaerolineaceae bacterium]|jgi:predicted nucleic acid-binding Zn ribbon protein